MNASGGSMVAVTYSGTSDTRSFTEDDAVGVELYFERGIATEVDDDVADFLLTSELVKGEFIRADSSMLDDRDDDIQEPIPGLLSDSE
jgi:hypothetical protein